ncbi:hypothetical protein CRM22_001707 [Opisthorchis felineus]|uniref:Oxysterol-binding protein n=1 Tax=Opisthorchis felineus TaxID=147828 RepID=A0A4S2MDR3_OPIFE|nr:hypothetical protein CRM22_001707 [Opisthorchis felineus]
MGESDIVSGYLLKWTNILKGYKKRWFLLQNDLLSYYRCPEAVGRRCRGTFNLKDATLVVPSSQTSFVLVEATGRKHHLKALSEQDKERWIKVLADLTNGHNNTDVESDNYSEDLVVNNTPESCQVVAGRRRFFRYRRSGRSKLGSKHSSSPNLPQDNGKFHKVEKFSSAPTRPLGTQLLVTTDQSEVQQATGKPTYSNRGTYLETENRSPPCPTSAFSHLLSRVRKPSLTTEASALHELVASVRSFQERLRNHTNSVCAHTTFIESLMSRPETNDIFGRPAPASGLSDQIPAQQESEQLIHCFKTALEEHRQYVGQFQETCSEALQFLVTNFERWHRRILAEQERCLGLERTIEQLARQHRALELQLAQYYAPLDSASFETVRAPQGGTLRRADTFERSASGNLESVGSTEDDQFFDAVSVIQYQSNEALAASDLNQSTQVRLPLPRTEGVRASATSLISLESVDESSGSDSCAEGSTESGLQIRHPPPATSERHRGKYTEAARTSVPPVSLAIRKRRTTIPPSPKIALNLWSIIKSGIGKDITKIPLPVNFNEPISFLQRASEDLTYSELLDRASETKDPVEQMACVAAFSVSCYATTAIRTGKPFNPLWGETFEFDRSDDSYGWRLIAEQVSHHPPGSALYCESVQHGWKIWLEFYLVSKFRGKYMSVFPKGTVNLLLPDGSRYTWTKATTVVHNLIVGSLWIDNYGDVVIRNHTSGYSCPMRFIAHTYFGRGPPKQVTGVIQNPSGNPKCLIRGCWDSYIESQPVSEDGSPIGDSKLLWRATPPPPGSENIYNFSLFTVELNELEPGIAPTDSRLRPDQRLMEDGAWDQANEEKRRIEQKQRAKRHRWEEEQASSSEPRDPLFTPCWFSLATDNVTGEQSYVYTGKYWEAKSRQDWSCCPDIY